MGRRPKPDIECPRGISIREFLNEKRIQLAFSYKAVECRELLKPCPITQANVSYAASLRAEILRKIKDDAFHYPDYFPSSLRAKQFDATGRRVLIGDLLQKQLELYERQAANGQLSPSTLEGYAKAVKSERMQHWSDKPLTEATPSALREWISGIGTTAKFTRNLLIPLRSVFEDALNDDLISSNPFERIALTKLLKQTSASSEYEVDPFSQEERGLILAKARSDELAMVQFWFATGLRPGELIALKWPKIDLDKRTATIDLNQVSGVEKGPKTDAGIRTLELNDDAIFALVRQKAVSFEAQGHVWLNPRTGEHWATDAQIRKTLWQPMIKRSGVRYRNPYQTRHTYASTLLTAGVNPWFVAQQLGHVDVTMVFTTYGKFIPQDYQKPKATLR